MELLIPKGILLINFNWKLSVVFERIPLKTWPRFKTMTRKRKDDAGIDWELVKGSTISIDCETVAAN